MPSSGSYSVKVVRPSGIIEVETAADRLNAAIEIARRIISNSDVVRVQVHSSGGERFYDYSAIECDQRPKFHLARDLPR